MTPVSSCSLWIFSSSPMPSIPGMRISAMTRSNSRPASLASASLAFEAESRSYPSSVNQWTSESRTTSSSSTMSIDSFCSDIRILRLRALLDRWPNHREDHVERGLIPRIHLYVAAVPLDQPVGNRESQSYTRSGLLGAEERLKNVGQHVLGNRRAVVADRQIQPPAFVDQAGPDAQVAGLPALARQCVHRVHHDSHQHLLDLRAVAEDLRQLRHLDGQLDRLHLELVLHHRHGPVDDRLHVRPGHLGVVLAREHQQVAYDLAAAPALVLDGLDPIEHRLLERQLLLQQTRISEDAGQRIVDLVRDGRGQLPEGGQLLGMYELFLRRFEVPGLAPYAILERAVGGLGLSGHAVELARQLADLVAPAEAE